MKIAIGNDHAGVEFKNKIMKELRSKGYEVVNVGTDTLDSVDYPDIAKEVSKKVLDEEVNFGILICGTGIGISIAANKIKGVRAALCTDTTTAKLTREHNDANILALGSGIVGRFVALDIVDTFLSTSFEGGRHKTRVDQIEVEGCNLF